MYFRAATAVPLSLILLIATPVPAASTDDAIPDRPTFTRDVLPIIQDNCQECHRPHGKNIMGMVAPMSFMNYQEVRPWAKAIAKQVAARTMPPWHASDEFAGVFKNERTLTTAEIDTIVRWVEQGAARGNPKDTPPQRTFKGVDGWAMGEPDLIVPFDQPYFVRDSVRDEYQTIMTRISQEDLPEDRWIQAMEFRPGSEAVHHIVIFTNDARESLGFPQGMLGGMGPGTDGSVFPEGYGRLLRAESSIIFNMHYHKEPGPGTGVWDHSSIGFKFHDKPVQHEVNWGAVGTMAFSIPPYAENYAVTAREKFYEDTLLLGLFPHTHLRGKAAKYTAFYPDGTEEVLLHVPEYDFNWQTNYVYREPKRIPAGTTIEVTMWYDNSEARGELAGIDPSRTVRWGQPTMDEMMYGWIDYTDAQPIGTD